MEYSILYLPSFSYKEEKIIFRLLVHPQSLNTPFPKIFHVGGTYSASQVARFEISTMHRKLLFSKKLLKRLEWMTGEIFFENLRVPHLPPVWHPFWKITFKIPYLYYFLVLFNFPFKTIFYSVLSSDVESSKFWRVSWNKIWNFDGVQLFNRFRLWLQEDRIEPMHLLLFGGSMMETISVLLGLLPIIYLIVFVSLLRMLLTLP